jgi:hypothetical protein
MNTERTKQEEPVLLKRDSSPSSRIFGFPGYYRPRQSAAVWQVDPPDWRLRLKDVLEKGLSNQPPAVFFRADDIGAGGQAFEALCRLFREHQVPLGLSVVPAWLSSARKDQLLAAAPITEPLWGWHQHGWRHVNWQRTGKKSEFGEQRPLEKQWRDIMNGQQKMQAIFGEHLLPVFTPPWNRLSLQTVKILQQLDFKAVSLDGPLPRGGKGLSPLRNLRVAVDLHTRKSRNPHEDFESLLGDLASVVAKKEPTGIMVHHHRMTLFAFHFLDELLSLLKNHLNADCLGFREILDTVDAP